MKRISSIYILVLALVFSGCFKEDDPVPPYVSPPGVITAQAETKPDYSMQTYYDLATNSFVSSNHREDWDISFLCRVGISAIYLNSAKRMRVHDTQSEDWQVAVTVSNPTLEWKFDESTGEPENTAFYGFQLNRIYVLDLGLSTLGSSLGYRKIRFTQVTEQTLSFEFADLSGNNVQAGSLTKNSDYNFVYFSFKNGGQSVFPEPAKNTYDLYFTHYTTRVFYEGSTTEFEWYLVNGTLLNPDGVAVAVDSTDNFSGITYADLSGFTFSTQRDFIGYDWKSYDIDAGVYTVLLQNTYLIRDRSGEFWKMRFVSFTNDLGERGYPTFEVAKF
ncbi:MAG: HmuY family protein [Flavobacteriales bacterium]|nr:HmuY family protein [Flavobacteriales bacterium]